MAETLTWRELYRAALLELQTEELGPRIAAAEMAILQRMLDLRQDDVSSEHETRDLEDALRGLRALKITECRSTDSTVHGLRQPGQMTP
jgi:hypothetical protein